MTTAATATPRYPLKVSANRRYLVDQEGRPFLYHGDTGWRIGLRLTRDEAIHYLDDRKARGFNAIHVHAINKEKEGFRNRAGHAPFEPETDVTRPNEPYWAHVDEILGLARDRGLLVALSASWFGYKGAGWRGDFTPETATQYGRFLGERYKGFPNILWIQGGDNDPGDKAEVARALATAIRERAPHQLHTYHAQSEHPSAQFFHKDPWHGLNMAYTYEPAYKQVLAEYRRPAPIHPIFLGETGYEGEANTGFPWTARLVRQQPYYALLSGACGHAQGSATVWHFGEGWQAALDKPATRQMAHVWALFSKRQWWKLVPDAAHETLTEGYGVFGEADYVAAARAEDGSFALAYLPSPRPVTVDLGRLQGRITARWVDPTDGSFTPIPSGDGGKQTVTPPAKNSAGEEDWVLALDARDGERSP